VALVGCSGYPQAPNPIGPAQPVAPSTAQSIYPPVLNGVYALTLSVGSGCAVIPEAERTRKYTATVDYRGAGRYVVTLGDATFLTGPICTAGSSHFSGLGCHQFFASEDIDTAQFFLANNNEAHGGHIVEQLSSGTWLEIIGSATGKLDSSSIEASGTSTVGYCRTPSPDPFPCSRVVSCASADMRLTLTRK
jgi:hypothetical protein